MLEVHRRRSRWLQYVAALIVLVAAATGLTEARVVEVSERPEIHLPVFSASQGNILPKTTNDEPVERITFDVSKALESIRRLHPEKDAEQELLEHFGILVQGRCEINDGKITVEVAAESQQAIRHSLRAVEEIGRAHV